jgi:hypothetical protein
MLGALCDLPAVIEVAREEIAAAGMTDRVALFPAITTPSPSARATTRLASLNLYYAKTCGCFWAGCSMP